MTLENIIDDIEKKLEKELSLLEPIKLFETQVLITYSLLAIKMFKVIKSKCEDISVDDIEHISLFGKRQLGKLYDKELYSEIKRNISKLSNNQNIY